MHSWKLPALYYENAKEGDEQEKNIQQKFEYIHKWIHLYRMESKLHLSLVADFATYCDEKRIKINVSEKEDRDYEISMDGDMLLWEDKLDIDNPVKMFKTIIEVASDESGRESKWVSEYYWWLPDDTMMFKYFDCRDREDLQFIIHTQYYRRKLYTMTVSSLKGYAKGIFYDFMSGDETAVDFMYHFCKEAYPLIETHKPYTLYKKADSKKKDGKIITRSEVTDIARNFLIYFCYKDNIIPMEEIQNENQKKMNRKYNKNVGQTT